MTGGELTRRPAVVSSIVSATAAVVATLSAGWMSADGLAVGVVGTVVVIAGLLSGSRGVLDVGCLVAFVGVVLGALAADNVEATLVGTLAVVVAWDVGQTGVDIGEQLGREAETTRLESVTLASSLLVGGGTVAVAYAVYAIAADRQPAAALVLLLVAATLVTIGLGTRRHSSSPRTGVGPR